MTVRSLHRNVIIHDERGFVGDWVAVPLEDFDALRASDKFIIDLINTALVVTQADTTEFGDEGFADTTWIGIIQPLRDALEAIGIDPDNTVRVGR